MSQYIVSARKYRPDSFGTLIGQDNIAQTLKNSILRGQLAHAYLFCGPRGVGKTTTARIFAKMINCSNPSDQMEPCGTCESCMSFAEGRSYCIHELDAASNNGVDDIKALMDQVRVPPQVGKYSVYIIDEVHMLSQAAFNAFLKTLEEPPAHAIFILATTEKHKILPTILSRCQTYDFNRITVDNIVKNLRMVASSENITIDDESLHVIAHKADGAMRDALTIFDQTVAFCGTDVKYQDVLRNLNVLDYEYSFSLVDAFLRGDYPSALTTFDEILTKGFNALHFVAALSSHLRDLVVSKSGGLEALLELPESLKIRYKEQAARCPMQFLYDGLGITTACESGYRASVNPRLHIEFALMRLAFLMKKPDTTAAAAPTVSQKTGGMLDGAKSQQPSRGSAEADASQKTGGTLGGAEPQQPSRGSAEADASQKTGGTLGGSEPQQPSRSSAGVAGNAAEMVETAAKAETEVEQPRERRARAARSNAGLSMKAMMQEELPQEQNLIQKEAPAPTEEEIRAKWPELALRYKHLDRLCSMLNTTTLTISDADDGYRMIVFQVVNDAQKNWVEAKMLHDLEGNLRAILKSMKIHLRVEVTPDDTSQERKIYMPGEQAEVLMKENTEVHSLVKDLGLDIK